MRRILTALTLFLPLLAAAQLRPSYGALEDSEAVAAMKEHVGYLASAALEGRKAGSEGEREAAAYVSEVLESYGLDLLNGRDGDIFGLKRENGDTLTSRNVLACIPGYDAALREHYIVIGDRDKDRMLAEAHGLPFIGCLYGYGSREELEGADALVNDPLEIVQAVEVIGEARAYETEGQR